MNPLESRKQQLIAESEFNRAQLSREWQAMTHGIREVTCWAKTLGAWAAAAALLVAEVTAWRSRSVAPGTVKPSWLQKILNGVRLASTIWFAFRARGQKQERESPASAPLGGSSEPE